jgi:lactoylglutathione lyase
MKVGELHHVVVSVSEMEPSIRFYRDGLGLRKTLDTEVRGAQLERMLDVAPGTVGRTVYLQGPTRVGQVELVEWLPMVDDPTPPKRLAEPGISVLSFPIGAEQLDDMHAHLTGMGYADISEPQWSVIDGYGQIGAFLIADPDGNLVELVSLPSDEEIRAHRDA